MSVSLLATDGYKFSMAQAGWPLRKETFYFSFRRGGPQVVPIDLAAFVESLRPSAKGGEREFLASHEYTIGDAFDAASKGALVVRAAPKGSWVLPREPIATITGPSALVSFLEPLLLQAHYRFQIATLALRDPDALARAVSTVTCEAQRAIVRESCDAVSVACPAMRVDEEGYAARVRERANAIVRALREDGRDAARIFEVGLRAASSMEQHLIALGACKEAGITRTSNVFGARALGVIPVGTMGHEHVQRFFSDEAAYRAMKERRPQRSSFLLDTFDTLKSGLPAAFEIMREDPAARDSIRYDSGDKEAQYLIACERARELGVRPVHVIEDGIGAEDVARFEALREKTGVRPDEQFYGSGGWLVSQTESPDPKRALTRDKVAAVFKLSRSGKRDVMKLSNDAGKISVPGVPVAWRRVSGDGPTGIVAQEGERVRGGYVRVDEARDHQALRAMPRDERVELSDETRALAERVKGEIESQIERRSS